LLIRLDAMKPRDALMPALYNELRRMALRQFWRERADHTAG